MIRFAEIQRLLDTTSNTAEDLRLGLSHQRLIDPDGRQTDDARIDDITTTSWGEPIGTVYTEIRTAQVIYDTDISAWKEIIKS